MLEHLEPFLASILTAHKIPVPCLEHTDSLMLDSHNQCKTPKLDQNTSIHQSNANVSSKQIQSSKKLTSPTKKVKIDESHLEPLI